MLYIHTPEQYFGLRFRRFIYSFDKYFQLCRSHTQTAVLIVQWMLGPHQGLGDIGQGNISM